MQVNVLISTYIHKSAIKKAEQSIEQKYNDVATINDAHRPTFHATPKVNWMNDPNGLIYYNHAYHLFYQHNPFSTEWGNIHWAHMKSDNLITWNDLPIALAPSEDYDRDGCFSGSAIEHEGKLYLFYTSNIFTSPQGLPDDLLQQQCLAISEDGGITFEKYARNPIISSPPVDIGDNNHFRDPKVWKNNDTWYMVLGTKKNQRGKVLLYKSTNLVDWQYVSVLVESDGSMGHMFECPDIFSLGDVDVLLVSPEGIVDYPISGYYVGKLNYETGQFIHGEFKLLDYGQHFYAPQTFLDHKGRRIMIGWMPMKGKQLNKSWSGCMTFPRELSLNENQLLLIKPASELHELRDTSMSTGQIQLDNEDKWLYHGNSIELQLTVNLAYLSAQQFGIRFFSSDEEEAIIGYDKANQQLYIDLSSIKASPYNKKYINLSDIEYSALKLQLILDRSTIELFINDGQYVFSGLVFPQEKSLDISLFATNGTATIEQLNLYSLKQ